MWSSKKQHFVSRSSDELEYQALALATAKVIWKQALLSKLHFKMFTMPILRCDYQGVIALANNPVYHAKTKHVALDIHFVREKVTKKT